MNNLKFSVVIPLFNKAGSIQQTLESVVAQKYAPSEIIVVNDGSNDKSVDIVKSLLVPNLRIIEQVNQGVSVARNVGVQAAKNQYIAFLDADDVWSPFYLSKMASLINHFPESKCFASAYQKQHEHQTFSLPKIRVSRSNPEGYLLHDYFKVVANGDLPFMMSSVIFKRDFYTEIGGCPVGEVMGEDQCLFSKAALASTIVYTSLILLSYRTDSDNRACERYTPCEQLQFAKRLMNNIGNVPKRIRPDVEKYCGAVACYLATKQIARGNIKSARKLLCERGVARKPIHKAILLIRCFAHTLLTGIRFEKGNIA